MGGARLRRIAPVAGESSVTGRPVTDAGRAVTDAGRAATAPEPGCPVPEAAAIDGSGRVSERSGVAVDRSAADIRAPGTASGAEGADVGGSDRAGASAAGAELPDTAKLADLATAGADQAGRTALSVRTPGRSCAERAMIGGSWARRMVGRPPVPAADGILAWSRSPGSRWAASRPETIEPDVAGSTAGRCGPGPSEPPARVAGARPAAGDDRLMERRLAIPSGRPTSVPAAGAPVALGRSDITALLGGSTSAAACRPRPEVACGGATLDAGWPETGESAELLAVFADGPATDCPPVPAGVDEDGCCRARLPAAPAKLRRMESSPWPAAAWLDDAGWRDELARAAELDWPARLGWLGWLDEIE